MLIVVGQLLYQCKLVNIFTGPTVGPAIAAFTRLVLMDLGPLNRVKVRRIKMRFACVRPADREIHLSRVGGLAVGE
jgi:hypothetical protein